MTRINNVCMEGAGAFWLMALDHPAAPPPAGPKFAGLWVWGPPGEFDHVRIYRGGMEE